MGELKHKKPSIHIYEVVGEVFAVLVTLLLEFFEINVSSFLTLVLIFVLIRGIIFASKYLSYYKEIESDREEIFEKLGYLEQSYTYKNNYIELLHDFCKNSLYSMMILSSQSSDSVSKETVRLMLDDQRKRYDEIILKEENTK